MKTACYLLLGVLTQSWHLFGQQLIPFNEKELENLATLEFNEIPRRIQIELLKEKKTGDSSHFCCAIDPNLSVGTILQSRIGTKTLIVSTKENHGSHGCGFFGSCSNGESVQYKQQLVTFIEHFMIPDKADCPDNRVVCCNNFIMVAQQCFNLSTVMSNTDFFKEVAAGKYNLPQPEIVG
uniref:Uncharacterized protein n=1 Tax=Pinctada fucata TaxID=50426 RepID=A0A194AM50_PINFU